MNGSKVPQTTDSLIDRAAELHQRSFCEKRDQERHPYAADVKFFLMSSNGTIRATIDVQTIDISQGGICIRSRNMFHIGAVGCIELLRSDGTCTLVGVEVRHCRYIGNMTHHTGLRFIPLPRDVEERLRAR